MTPSEYLRIELKTDRPDKKTQHVRIAADDSGPFENSQIRISRSQCPPQDQCRVTDYPAVIVTLNDRSVGWYDIGSVFKNSKPDAARQIRVELKTKPIAVTR